jgi:hypothetical protein
MGLMVEKLGMQSIEIFRTRDELFNRMLELSIDSQMINTQMFSDPPDEIGGQMEKYFKKLSAHTKKNSSLVFRRIATIGGNNKVRWIFKILFEMIGTQNFSLAYINVNHSDTPVPGKLEEINFICLRRPFGESLFEKSSAKTFNSPLGKNSQEQLYLILPHIFFYFYIESAFYGGAIDTGEVDAADQFLRS